MTFDVLRKEDARTPVAVCEMLLDGCRYEYGKSYTNLLRYSEQFDNAAWTKSSTTISPDVILAPDGTLTADKIVEDTTASSLHNIEQDLACTAGLPYTFSLYLKAGERTKIRMYCTGAAFTLSSCDVDLLAGTITKAQGPAEITNYGIEDMGGGWYRAWLTNVADATDTGTFLGLLFDDTGAVGYTGDGVSGLYVWGGQVIQDSKPGHYVQTTSTSTTAGCSATGAAGSECYNTFATCQVIPDYTKILKLYRFFQPVSNWPAGVKGYPALKSEPAFTPCKIDPRGSIGQRGTTMVSLQDFADDDVDTDPYYATRSYSPEAQGTFFGKLKSRMPYYKGRRMRILHGYIGSPFSWADFELQEYVVDALDFSRRDTVSIKGKDLLKLVDDKKAVAPDPSSATLSVAYTAGNTTLELQAGEGADFVNDPYTGSPISASLPGYVRIGDNVLSYTGVSTDTLTGVVGGQKGSTDDGAAVGDSVQQCLNFDNVNVVDIVSFLLLNYTDLLPIHIPYDNGATGVDDEWDVEKTAWLSGNNLFHLVTKPTGIKELLQRICEQNLMYLWFDAKEQKVKLKAIAPAVKNETPPTLTDAEHIIDDSVTTADNTDGRISRVQVFYSQRDVAGDKDKAENYARLKVIVDTESESTNAHSEKAIRTIYADWMTDANEGLILTLAGRLLSRYAGVPNRVNFEIDYKDMEFWAGNVVILETEAFQGPDGAAEPRKMQILKAAEDSKRQRVKLEGETWDYKINKYGFIGPNTLGDYTTESDSNRQSYGFIAQNDGKMTNGDDGYLIA